MIKKHLVSCTTMLFALIISKLFIFGTPAATKNTVVESEVIDHVINEHNKDVYYASFNFANEAVPMEVEKVEKRVIRVLEKFSYSNIRSHKLHRLSEDWFKVIEPILEKHGIPEDFKYVPLVESGLKQGVSSKGAAGYWQFMPNTARAFGLVVNDEVDERYDLRKSSEAAARYINGLYSQFGSWTLVAAAYNVGEGNLHRSIKRQKQRDYYQLSLNRETAAYVYRIVSMKQIIENPSEYGYRNASSSRTLLAENNKENQNDQNQSSTVSF